MAGGSIAVDSGVMRRTASGVVALGCAASGIEIENAQSSSTCAAAIGASRLRCQRGRGGPEGEKPGASVVSMRPVCSSA